jgi:crotonobetainyl-CoA:carnitine CoA-transferase CaiB-like acyl-CoA transferase
MCGNEDGLPTKMPVAMIDILAAHQLKEAILIALWKLSKENVGSYVETSLYSTAIASLVNQGSNYLMNGIVPQRMGSLHPNIAPYGEILKTNDGLQYVLAIGNNKQFENLCNALECTEILLENTFGDNKSRVGNRKSLITILENKALKLSGAELQFVFDSYEVPYGKINTLVEVFENKNAKNMILEDKDDNDCVLKRVKSVAFTIQ